MNKPQKEPKKPNALPESLRQQLSKAGKARAAHLTYEQRSRGGKTSWANRLKRAREAEALERAKKLPRNVAPNAKGIF